jgi:hypothetical protein
VNLLKSHCGDCPGKKNIHQNIIVGLIWYLSSSNILKYIVIVHINSFEIFETLVHNSLYYDVDTEI